MDHSPEPDCARCQLLNEIYVSHRQLVALMQRAKAMRSEKEGQAAPQDGQMKLFGLA
jgi:hypothetical protein